ncbi:unnamed protein product [Rhizophagus irregularis]|nr:unnamed protein product [Rhizophagus irregularis]
MFSNVFFILLYRKSVPAWIPFPRKSVPAWIPIFQEIGSSVDADIPEIGSNVNADIPGIRLQRGRRYSKIRFQRGRRYSRNSAPTWTPIFQNSVPTWIPIFQEIGSNVDADIPDKAIGSSLDTETQDKDRFRRGYRNPKGTEKTKIRRVDFRRIDEPRFVSASRWIYRFRLSVLGLWMYRFQLSVSTFGSWVLDRYRFPLRTYITYIEQIGFPLRIFGWVSLSDFCQIE